jgi:TPP-dependent trihydroxycyclohexane-1,2-dione (THcHDO) dehydratase
MSCFTWGAESCPRSTLLPSRRDLCQQCGRCALRWFAEVLKVDDIPGLDLPGIDFLSLAKGYGVEGINAVTTEELRHALTTALAAETPTLTEVATLAEGF